MTWQPIATAPKDIRILLYCPDTYEWASIATGIWIPLGNYWFNDIESDRRFTQPTHWMELPEPPKGLAMQAYDKHGNKIDPPTADEYLDAMIDVFEAFAPKVYECDSCGWPVADGYLCRLCGHGNSK